MALKTSPSLEKLKLDKIDKKILFYLLQDLRYPRKKLSSELKISPQKLAYRITRLMEELIQPTLLINYPLLKINSYVILLENLKEEDIKKVENASETYFFMQLIGKYPYYLQIISEDVEEFCKNYLKDYVYEIHPLHEYIPDDFNPFGFKFKNTREVKKEKFVLDKYDYTLLLQIAKDPLQSNLEISQKANIDRITVKKRLDKLLELGIIQRFRYAIDVFKYGFILYSLKIKVPLNSMQKILKFIHEGQFSGHSYRSFNTIFMSYIPPTHVELFSFVEILKKLDLSIEIETMQNIGKYVIEPVPAIVKRIFQKRISNKQT